MICTRRSMRSSQTALSVLAFAFAVAAPVIHRVEAGSESVQVAQGRLLFEANWLHPPADDSPIALARSGDGLGPLFNGASCVECHHLGGAGGGGGSEQEVFVLSAVLPPEANSTQRTALLRRASAFHPAFREKPHVVLHVFGFDAEGDLRDYESFRAGILQQFPASGGSAARSEIVNDAGRFQLARRNTTAMFGVGVIDQIPAQMIQNLAMSQQTRYPAEAGRAALDGLGRFGWRGQVATLDDFVRTACAEECGLRVNSRRGAVIDQAASPLEADNRRRRRLVVDLTEIKVTALVAFSRSLPAPEPGVTSDEAANWAAHRGRDTFSNIGCAICHVEHVGMARFVYSDFLLHRMGPELADLVKAPPVPTEVVNRMQRVTTPSSRPIISAASYYGASPSPTPSPQPPSLGAADIAAQEWKTPPLWGVADSAPYLHDGRAATLDEAIRLHGGQAQPAALRYVALPEPDRDRLLTFLETLKAPRVE